MLRPGRTYSVGKDKRPDVVRSGLVRPEEFFLVYRKNTKANDRKEKKAQ